MPLKYNVDNLDSVNAEHRGLYVKDEASGKYRLDVEGAVPREKLDEFRNNNVKLQNQLTEATANLEKFKDIDPAKYQEYKTKAEAAKGDSDIEQIVQQRLQTATSEYTANKTKLETDLNTANQKLNNFMIGTEVRNAAIKVGALPTAVDDVVSRANGIFTIVNDKVVIQKDGQTVYGSDGVTPLSAVEWAKNLSKDAPHLFSQNQGGGAQGGGNGGFGNKDRSKMSSQEKILAGLEDNGL